jgi:hypothetical protein
MLTPATAKFCLIGEAQFGSNNHRSGDDYGKGAMLGWVDAQNAFSAMIRRHFIVVFKRGNPTVVEQVCIVPERRKRAETSE